MRRLPALIVCRGSASDGARHMRAAHGVWLTVSRVEGGGHAIHGDRRCRVDIYQITAIQLHHNEPVQLSGYGVTMAQWCAFYGCVSVYCRTTLQIFDSSN